MLQFAKSGIFIAIVAHGLIGISLVWDKILLKTPGTKNLLGYVFWLGSISVFGVVLVPFGYQRAHVWVIVLAFGTGIIDLVAVFFYYLALKMGEASETLAVMGGFSPVATVAISYALLSKQLRGEQLIGFAVMTAGGFVMFLSENFPLKKLLPPVLLASGLLGLENVLLKVVYNHTNFVTGYVWFTIGTFVGAMALLVPTSWRKQILQESEEAEPSSRFWYFVNRFIAGLGAFLVTYAISLTHPALVDAISGVRYAVIFIGAYLFTKLKPNWLEEEFGGWELVTKVVATLLVVAGLVLAGIAGSKMSGSSVTALQEVTPRMAIAEGGRRCAKVETRTYITAYDL